MTKRNNNPDMAELLQTTDKTEQAKRVQQLIQLANAPILDILFRVDTRMGKIDIFPIGTNLSANDLHMILDQAKEQLRKFELEELKKQPVEVPADLSTSKE